TTASVAGAEAAMTWPRMVAPVLWAITGAAPSARQVASATVRRLRAGLLSRLPFMLRPSQDGAASGFLLLSAGRRGGGSRTAAGLAHDQFRQQHMAFVGGRFFAFDLGQQPLQCV